MYDIIFHWALALIIINTLVLSVATSFFAFTDPYPKSFWSKIFYATGHVSQMFIYSLFIGIGLFTIGIISLNPLIFIPLGSIICMGVLFFLIANSVVYSKYRFNINRAILALVFSKGASEVVQPSLKESFIFFSGIVFAFLVPMFLLTAIWAVKFSPFIISIIYLLFTILLLCYLFNQLLYFIYSHTGYMPILQYTVKICGYDMFSLYRLFHKSGVPLTNQNNELIHNLKASFNQTKLVQYPLKPIKATTPEKPLNVLMIIIDSWRFDMLCPQATPNIYKFANHAEYFSNHWSSGNTTQPGLFGLFYGIPSNYWEAVKKQQISPVLIDQLQKAGYHTEVLASANLVNPPFNKTIFSTIPNLRAFTPGNSPLERDQNITETMTDFLTQQNQSKQPFFGFLFYDSAHGYYAIPDIPLHFKPVKKTNHISMARGTDPTPFFNLYRNALYCVDQYVQDVLTALEKTNLLDNTMVIITGDHGQEFDDLNKNCWEHPSNFSRYQVKVPLVIKQPNRAPQRYQHLTTHYDIQSMLLQDVLGVQNKPADYGIGTNLYNTSHRLPFVMVSNYTNHGIIERDRIINLQLDGHYQVTDWDLNQLEPTKSNIATIEEALKIINRYYSNQKSM